MGAADRLGEMALAGAGWAKEKGIFALADEARGGEVVNERAIHLFVEIEIKPIERAVRVAEALLLVAAVKEPVLSPLRLVAHERGDEVDRRQLLRLRVAQPGLEDIGHPREAEFSQREIEFDERHVGSPVSRSMRSR